jgi:hypothetical protein
VDFQDAKTEGEVGMQKSRFTEAQILAVLKEG